MNIVFQLQEFIHGKIMYMKTYQSVVKGFQNDETGAWDMGLADRETMSYASGKYGNTLISFTGRFTYAYKDRLPDDSDSTL